MHLPMGNSTEIVHFRHVRYGDKWPNIQVARMPPAFICCLLIFMIITVKYPKDEVKGYSCFLDIRPFISVTDMTEVNNFCGIAHI